MPTFYSNDLRLRIARAYLAGEGTRAEIAERFHVSPASVDRFVRRNPKGGFVSFTPVQVLWQQSLMG